MEMAALTVGDLLTCMTHVVLKGMPQDPFAEDRQFLPPAAVQGTVKSFLCSHGLAWTSGQPSALTASCLRTADSTHLSAWSVSMALPDSQESRLLICK